MALKLRKRSVCVLLGIIFLFQCHTAGAEKKDSLLAAISSLRQDDTLKVLLLTDVAELYAQTHIDSMELFAQEAFSMSQRLRFEKGIAYSSSQLGLVALHKDEFAKALSNYQQALDYYEKTGNLKGQAHTLLYMGDIYYRDTKFSLSIECYNKAIAASRKIDDLKSEGLGLIDIGGIYTDEGSYAEAINYYLKGLKTFEKRNDNSGISMTLVNIANVYSMMGDYKQALEYVNKSLPITKGITDKEVIFSNMVNIGVIYAQMKDHKNALAAYNSGLAMAESMGDNTWINSCLGNLADEYVQLGEYDTALSKYKRLLKQNQEIKDTSFIITAEAGIGNVLIKQGKIKDGINTLVQAIGLAKVKQMKQTIFDVAGQLSSAYEQAHDYTNALKYHKIYYDYRDSLNNEQSNKRIQQLQFDYELGKKQHQIELLEKDGVIAKGRNEQQRVVTIALVIGVALLIVISIILYRGRSYEKRNKEEILKQKEEIQQQAARLEELNRFKDKTFSVLSHDLRTPLGALTSTMMLLDKNVISPDEFSMLKYDLGKQLGSVNILLDNLLNWAKSYFHGKIASKPTIVNLYNIASQNIHLLNDDTVGGKNISLVNKIEPYLVAYCDAGQIDIVIRNLLSNAVKFTPADGTVTISARGSKEKVQVTVTDNGVGMTPEQLSKIFTATANNTTYGTGGERGIGLGLLLCYDFVRANNGSISATSEIDKGSTFTVELPTGPGSKPSHGNS